MKGEIRHGHPSIGIKLLALFFAVGAMACAIMIVALLFPGGQFAGSLLAPKQV